MMNYTPEQLAWADELFALIARQPRRTQNLILALFEAAVKSAENGGEHDEH